MNLLPGMEDLLPQVSSWRREIHAHPELGFQEVRTSALVRRELEAMGLELITDFCEAKTAVIGLLRTGREGPVVALRADMDALPMQDEKDVPYRSQNPVYAMPAGMMPIPLRCSGSRAGVLITARNCTAP